MYPLKIMRQNMLNMSRKEVLNLEVSFTTLLPFGLSTEIVTQWVIMLLLTAGGYLLTRDLKRIPDKKQAALEKLYVSIESLVSNTMGESYISFVPYIGTLVIFLLCMNFTGLIGIAPPTQSLSVTFGLALTTFFAIHSNAIRKNGPIGYIKGYAHPFILMAPITLMERVMLPVSLALRLFGNMYAATVLVDLVYESLPKLGLPIIAHAYFDLFDCTIQMLVFTMLTMIQIKLTAEE